MKRLGLMIMTSLFCGVMSTSCESNKEKETDNKELCFHFNSGNFDKTMPVINVYLERLTTELTDEKKLQSLTGWLKSCPCIIDATILCVGCIKTLPEQSEISISVKKNGKTEDIILDILMSDPIKAVNFHEHY